MCIRRFDEADLQPSGTKPPLPQLTSEGQEPGCCSPCDGGKFTQDFIYPLTHHTKTYILGERSSPTCFIKPTQHILVLGTIVASSGFSLRLMAIKSIIFDVLAQEKMDTICKHTIEENTEQ